jgi:hypothetical protein
MFTTMDLVRAWTPPPQSSEQDDQADQLESLQSIGQAKVLQVAEALRELQPAPPWRSWVRIDLVWVLLPPPQVLVHMVQLDQSLSLQSTGQAKVMQDWVISVARVHKIPP